MLIDVIQTGTSETTSCSASICAHGDNDLHVFVSYDGGSSYESLSYKAGWAATTELESVFAPPFYATLRFEVDDYKHTGGFMATVSVECDDGYEATYITDKGNTMFDVVYALSGNTVMSEFYKFGMKFTLILLSNSIDLNQAKFGGCDRRRGKQQLDYQGQLRYDVFFTSSYCSDSG